MLCNPVVRRVLARKSVVLASASPRRSEILSRAGFDFEIYPSQVAENLSKDCYTDLADYALDTAQLKAKSVVADLVQLKKNSDIIIAADTVVIHNGKIYEKPKDDADAYAILSTLSGGVHQVATGVCFAWRHSTGWDDACFRYVTFREATDVTFANLSPDTIRGYVASGESADKAGGYGIQALGCTLVTHVQGDYFNVMGLPVHRLAVHISRLCVEEEEEGLQGST